MEKVLTIMVVAAFLFSAGIAFAKSEKCTVDTVEGDKVTMTCKETKLKPGDSVKVKVQKKKEVEGC